MVGRLAGWVGALLVLGGYLLRPFVGSYLDEDVVALAATGSPGRWIASSALVALGFGGLGLAVSWAAGVPGSNGHRTKAATVAPIAMSMGAILLALQLGATAAATVGASDAGADPVAVFRSVRAWEGPLIALVLVSFAVSWFSLAYSLLATSALSRREGVAFTGSVVVAAVGLLIPSSWGEYLSGVALVAGFWLLAVSLQPVTKPEAPAARLSPSKSSS